MSSSEPMIKFDSIDASGLSDTFGRQGSRREVKGTALEHELENQEKRENPNTKRRELKRFSAPTIRHVRSEPGRPPATTGNRHGGLWSAMPTRTGASTKRKSEEDGGKN
ncbi:hypothetical protein NL676_000815 [Syzygium grande]|nr:hypothetical protein NL676_000815 [Syzygium grande]